MTPNAPLQIILALALENKPTGPDLAYKSSIRGQDYTI